MIHTIVSKANIIKAQEDCDRGLTDLHSKYLTGKAALEASDYEREDYAVKYKTLGQWYKIKQKRLWATLDKIYYGE